VSLKKSVRLYVTKGCTRTTCAIWSKPPKVWEKRFKEFAIFEDSQREGYTFEDFTRSGFRKLFGIAPKDKEIITIDVKVKKVDKVR